MKIFKIIDLNRIPLIVFFISFFFFISFAGTRLFFSDEGIIIDQFYNFINGSLAIEMAKIDTAKGIFISVGDNLYGKFSYSLFILSLPVYYILKLIDTVYSAHLFLLQLWALSGGIIVYLIAKTCKLKYAVLGIVLSYSVLITVNLAFFKPIFFPKWGELLSIEFTNIIISSFLVLVVYLLFANFFNKKIGIFASLFIIMATPISFYAITLKHHSLAIFLTLLTVYFFYEYKRKNENKFIYLAYLSAGLCVWTRTLDGALILASLLLVDIFVLRRNLKFLRTTFLVILISMLPFLSFNYLIQGEPFSIIETLPLTDRQIEIQKANDFIKIGDNPANTKQMELLNELGYVWSANISGFWIENLYYMLFSRLANTFGIFLISPFLITSLAFILDRLQRKIKLDIMDTFIGLYSILLIISNRNFILAIVTDTPIALEYRYLLPLYVAFLYFSLRIDKFRDIIESNLKAIGLIYGFALIVFLSYFIGAFPVKFLDVYFYAASTSFILLLILIMGLLVKKRPAGNVVEKLTIFIVALSIAEASFLMLYYYWVVSMTYISPSQNFTIIPILGNILEWMYRIIIINSL